VNFRVYLWVGFNLFVLAMLALDLGLARRREEAPSSKSSVVWCLVWVGVSLGIFGAIWGFWHTEKAFQFLTGYVIEYALSVDNLFVFVLIFGHFQVPPRWQHKMLFWGILGAFLMRASLIVAGVALVERFHWLFYFFGAFLMLSAARLIWGGRDEESDPPAPEGSRIFRLARKILPIAESEREGAFSVRKGARLYFTPLFLVLLLVEVTDLVFALDSIPAVLAVSNDRFILYSSNVCAILGLRTLFFLVARLMAKLRYLNAALAVVLGFIGLKMIVHSWIEVPTFVSLGVVGGVLGLAVVASMLRPERT
jgi:tellurite resistance protein TerC